MGRLFVGVEIGGTKTQVALGNDQGEILHLVQEEVVLAEGAAGILRWVGGQIDGLIERAQGFGGRVAGICVGFGGFIESSTGRILTSVQVQGWKDMMLKQWFEDRSGLPTIILNDTVAGGYGEYHLGSGRGVRQFFYTNIGSGIGGVFVFNGQCFDGQGYGGAYFGHTYLPDWTAGVPGVPRKVEDLCSGWAIERRLRSPGYVPGESALMVSCGEDVSRITCQALGAAATAGDAFALAEIDRIAHSFSIGLANVLTLISAERVSIGGGVGKLGEILLGPIRRYTDEYVLITNKGRYDIVSCVFGDAAVLVGAVLYAAYQLASGSSSRS
ncbi:MAG: ROK family protein [Phycisphaerae bacterium]|nr:ROK family protein [Phycisphaerae bacterium]